MSVWNQIWAPPRPNNLKTAATPSRVPARPGRDAARAGYSTLAAGFYTDPRQARSSHRARRLYAQNEELAQRNPEDREARIFYALFAPSPPPTVLTRLTEPAQAGDILSRYSRRSGAPGSEPLSHSRLRLSALVDRALAGGTKYAIA